jgi:hypothetical protein
MAELLQERVKQLEEIEERLERIEKRMRGNDSARLAVSFTMTCQLRADVKRMIEVAKEEYAKF